MRRVARTSGLTLVEVIIAALIVAVVAGGTMMAFIASANMTGPYTPTGPQDLPSLGEANHLAQELVESQRNEVVAGGGTLATQVALGWQKVLMPASSPASKLTGGRRCYRVVNADCDGVGGPGDCFGIQAKVCWNNLTECPCPP